MKVKYKGTWYCKAEIKRTGSKRKFLLLPLGKFIMAEECDEIDWEMEDIILDDFEYIPFDIEKAKQGVPVVFNFDHQPVRIVCWDAITDIGPILGVFFNEEKEVAMFFSEKGTNPNITHYLILKVKKEWKPKPGESVIGRMGPGKVWNFDIFNRLIGETRRYSCLSQSWSEIRPFNEKTEKLIGTNEDYKE